jgi:hypothetical protein
MVKPIGGMWLSCCFGKTLINSPCRLWCSKHGSGWTESNDCGTGEKPAPQHCEEVLGVEELAAVKGQARQILSQEAADSINPRC